MSDRALVVFVRYPQSGEVKTRLMPALGADDAAGLYRVLAEAVLGATAPGPGEYERLVFFDPPEALGPMRSWLPAVRLFAQSGDDLGARMSHAFARAFARGARRVAIVGTDAPGVDRQGVSDALDTLGGADVVLGPAVDGGYYLIALSRPRPELLEGVAWSTPAVLEQTLARASALGLDVLLLPTRRDVDTIEDVREEWPRLRPLLEPHTELLQRIEAHLGRPRDP